jgi:hypothetical protein
MGLRSGQQLLSPDTKTYENVTVSSQLVSSDRCSTGELNIEWAPLDCLR